MLAVLPSWLQQMSFQAREPGIGGWGVVAVLGREIVHEKSSGSTTSLMLNIVSLFHFSLSGKEKHYIR